MLCHQTFLRIAEHPSYVQPTYSGPRSIRNHHLLRTTHGQPALNNSTRLLALITNSEANSNLQTTMAILRIVLIPIVLLIGATLYAIIERVLTYMGARRYEPVLPRYEKAPTSPPLIAEHADHTNSMRIHADNPGGCCPARVQAMRPRLGSLSRSGSMFCAAGVECA